MPAWDQLTDRSLVPQGASAVLASGVVAGRGVCWKGRVTNITTTSRRYDGAGGRPCGVQKACSLLVEPGA